MNRLALAGVALVLAGPAAAQTPPPPPEGPPEGQARPEPTRMVEAYFLANLQESLQLTDEQYVKVLPPVKRLLSARRELAQRRLRALQAMRRQFRTGSATDASVAEALRELKAVEEEEVRAVRKDREAVDAVLTPLQQAKYRVFEMEVEQRLRGLMDRVRGRARGGPLRRPPGDPGPL
jgi:hypothetical protein